MKFLSLDQEEEHVSYPASLHVSVVLTSRMRNMRSTCSQLAKYGGKIVGWAIKNQ